MSEKFNLYADAIDQSKLIPALDNFICTRGIIDMTTKENRQNMKWQIIHMLREHMPEIVENIIRMKKEKKDAEKRSNEN